MHSPIAIWPLYYANQRKSHAEIYILIILWTILMLKRVPKRYIHRSHL